MKSPEIARGVWKQVLVKNTRLWLGNAVLVRAWIGRRRCTWRSSDNHSYRHDCRMFADAGHIQLALKHLWAVWRVKYQHRNRSIENMQGYNKHNNVPTTIETLVLFLYCNQPNFETAYELFLIYAKVTLDFITPLVWWWK